jgi:beta-phosphoglucomutase-like phosphatase (HAD superfamily)
MMLSTLPFTLLRTDRPVGFLFDVDGLLIDNCLQIHSAYEGLLSARRIAPEPGERFPGINLFDIVARMKEKYGLPVSVKELVRERREAYLEILSREDIDPCDGVAELLQFLDKQRRHMSIRLAYVSSSEKCFVEQVLKKMFQRIGLPQYCSDPDSFFYGASGMTASISWGPGLEKKPHPMLYEMACRKLALEPSQCIAFEDSTSGYLAALNAGLNLVAVDNGEDRTAPGKFRQGAQWNGRVCRIKSLREFLAMIQMPHEGSENLTREGHS